MIALNRIIRKTAKDNPNDQFMQHLALKARENWNDGERTSVLTVEKSRETNGGHSR